MRRWTMLLLLSFACSQEKPAAPAQPVKAPALPPPTAEQARAIVAESSDFSEYEFTNAAITLPLSAAQMNEEMKAEARDLERAGWLRVRGGAVELTAKAKSDRRFLVRQNGYVDVVPLAKKVFGQVTAVRANHDGSADADFTWSWSPNEIGAALKSGSAHDRYAAPQQATARLINDGAAWSVLRITPAERGRPRPLA
jgi:hypothetical protein